MAKTTPPTYRQLQVQLDEVMTTMEDPTLDIDVATAAYERGLKLISQLQDYLQQAENKIERLQTDFSRDVPE